MTRVRFLIGFFFFLSFSSSPPVVDDGCVCVYMVIDLFGVSIPLSLSIIYTEEENRRRGRKGREEKESPHHHLLRREHKTHQRKC